MEAAIVRAFVHYLQPGRSLALRECVRRPAWFSPARNRKAGHRGVRAMLVFGRTPGRSAEFPGGRAGEALFTYWLTASCQSMPLERDGRLATEDAPAEESC